MKLSPAPFRDPVLDADGRLTRAWQEWFGEVQRILGAMPSIQKFAGTPQSKVPGAIGDVVTSTTGGANVTLYIKESGAGTTTGWVAK